MRSRDNDGLREVLDSALLDVDQAIHVEPTNLT